MGDRWRAAGNFARAWRGAPQVAAFGGAVLALAFSRAEWHVFGWVGLVPLFAAIDGRSPGAAARLGWVYGLTFFSLALYWIVPTIATYTAIPVPVALAALLLLSGVLALYTAAFAAGTAVATRGGVALVVFAPLWWVALEWLRSWLFTGFPWASLGYSQHRHRFIVQMVEVTGVYGVSALLVLFNVVVFSVLGRRGTRKARACQLGALSLLMLGAHQFGAWRLRDLARRPPERHLRAAVVQGNIPQDVKWNPGFQETTVDTYARLSRAAARQGATLIVWPETAAPFFFQTEGPFSDRLRALARETGAWLLFGSPAFERAPGAEARLRNRAYLVAPDGSTAGFSDKVHLVPFGEYVPLKRLLFFVDQIVEGIGGFEPGPGPTTLTVAADHVGALICYEAIFPALVRQFVAGGADLLVNLTNDAWYGQTAAPEQHFAMAAVRAVENRVPLLRAANTGYSAFVLPDGRVLQRTELFEPAVRVADLAWPLVHTWYTRYGDVFAVGCTGASGGLLLACLWRRRRGI